MVIRYSNAAVDKEVSEVGTPEEICPSHDRSTTWSAPHVVPLTEAVNSELVAAATKSTYFSTVMGMYIATNSIC